MADGNGLCGLVLQVVSLGWAFSAWTKASVLLQASIPAFRRMIEDDRRTLSCFYLFSAYCALRCLRIARRVRSRTRALLKRAHERARGSQKETLALAANPLLGHPRLFRGIAGLAVAVIVTEEVALHLLLAVLFGRQPRVQPKWRASSAAHAHDADEHGDVFCVICRSADKLGALQSYCPASAGHLMHRECIETWAASRLRNAKACPVCRQPLDIRASVLSALSPREIARHFNVRFALARSLTTISYVVLALLVTHLTRRRFERLLAMHSIAEIAQAR